MTDIVDYLERAESVPPFEGGVFTMPDAEYHAQTEWLSSTGARKLLPPSCPALFQHWRTHGEAPKPEWDMGSAAHRLVLGVGAEIHVIDAHDYRTKAAQTARDEARGEGHIPLLPSEMATVQAMADALRAHPVAAALFNPDHGEPEQSLFWADEETGVPCRARMDWLPKASGGRMVAPDYKTARAVDPRSLSKAVYEYHYEQQAAWYLSGLRALGLADESAAFVFVAQMKTDPYLVTVFQLDAEALAAGERANRQALEIYRDCTETNLWPGFADDVLLVGLPRWATSPHEEF